MVRLTWAQVRDALRSHARAFTTALLAIAATLTIVVTLDDTDKNGHPDQVTIVVRSADGQAVKVTTPAAVVDQAAAGSTHEGQRTEQPEGVPAEDLQAADEQQEQLAATDQLPIVTPDAAPEQAGCVTRLVSNRSSRRGVRPRLFVLHYTVSPNRPGWSDVNAIVSLFDRPAFAASSNYVIDREGNCALIVRESDKAWTQAAFNPVAISVEQINTGRETSYAGRAGLAKLASVISDSTRRWEIPLQQGAVNGCTVTRPGVIDHGALGACGGGHVDIAPFRVGEVLVAARAHRARSAAARRVTSVDRRTCRKLNAWRRAGRPKGGLWERRSVRRRRALDARMVTCTPRGPVKGRLR